MDSKKLIHFIGIGGIGISGLARLYLHEGWKVSGSDLAETELSKKLETEGISVRYEQDGNLIIYDKPDIFVYSDAVKSDNPERAAAEDTGKPVMSYFEALGEVANKYYLIAVAGTHGKTTTTAMIIDIMEEAGLDPTAIVGSLRSKTGSNFRAGKSKFFVVEADEYRGHFLHLDPDILMITNLEHDHPDYYPDLASVQNEFRKLVMKMGPDSRLVVCNATDPNLKLLIESFRGRLKTYDRYLKHPDFLQLQLRQPGLHMLRNAAAAMAATSVLEVGYSQLVPFDVAARALENFAGTWRRFQYKGDVNGAPVYDDYAHHPTEIAATLAGAREKYPEKKIIVVFQPHTYSRTKSLFNDFVRELSKADRVILVPIYASREKDDGSISSQMIAEQLNAQGVTVEHFHTLEAAAQSVKETVGNDDVVLVMGAGDVTQVASKLTE